jgi:multiple sugar transport system permease protein
MTPEWKRSCLRYSVSFRRGVFLSVAIALCILPLVWTVLASFAIMPENVSLHPFRWMMRPSIDPYREVGIQEPAFAFELATSAGLAASTTVLTLSISVLAAYAIARSQFRGKELIVQCLLVLACVPVISYIIPLRKMLHAMRLYDTFGGALLAETALLAPLAAYVLCNFFRRVSREQEESAKIDGAGTFQVLLRVVLPASAPGIASTAIIVFVLGWNQVLMPLLLSMPVNTIPAAMIDFFMYERELEWPAAAAALVVSFMPIVLFVAASHRLIEQFSLEGFRETE